MPSNNADRETLSGPQKIKLALLRRFAGLLRWSGYGGIHLLARFGAFCFWRLARSRRKMAVHSIMRHLGKNEAEASAMARLSFQSNFQSFLEVVLARDFPLYDNPRLKPLPPYFRQMMDEERPVVAVLGHLGSWELLAGFMDELRPGRPTVVVVRSQRSPVFNEFMRELRSSEDSRAVGHRNASAEVMSALRKNGTTAFLVDHNAMRQEAVFLPFLGELAAVNMGPALLALRGKAVVYPLCLIREGKDNYRLEALAPLDTQTLEGGISERAQQIAEFYTRSMETMIRLCPEQWFWMHKRWKTQPRKSK